MSTAQGQADVSAEDLPFGFYNTGGIWPQNRHARNWYLEEGMKDAQSELAKVDVSFASPETNLAVKYFSQEASEFSIELLDPQEQEVFLFCLTAAVHEDELASRAVTNEEYDTWQRNVQWQPEACTDALEKALGTVVAITATASAYNRFHAASNGRAHYDGGYVGMSTDPRQIGGSSQSMPQSGSGASESDRRPAELQVNATSHEETKDERLSAPPIKMPAFSEGSSSATAPGS